MLASPEMTSIARNCGVWAVRSVQAPHPKPPKIAFWGLQNSQHRNLEMFHIVHHQDTDSRPMFQKWLKSVQDKCPKGCVTCLPLPPKNHIFVLFGRNPGKIPPTFWVIHRVSWSLTSPFSTNMAISETKGQGWRAIPTQWRKASDILTSTLAAFLFSSHPKRERDRKAL